MKKAIFMILFLSKALLFPHEVLFEKVKKEPVVLKFYFADGTSLSYANYEIFAPGDKIPYQKGRTDRNGYLSFVPNTEGEWRVKVIEESGHGLETRINIFRVNRIEERSNFRSKELFKFFGGILFISLLFFLFYSIGISKKRRLKK
ncbi:MAG: hypothetical protein ACUVUG_10115 [Candidatus Aminicenantia bacterium]